MRPNRVTGYRTKDEPICVILTSQDTDDPFRSSGAIIMEQYPSDSPEQVIERAQSFADGGKYGRVWVGTVGDLKEMAPLNAPPDAVVELLRAAKCPDAECGGQGFSVVQGDNGEAEQQQCQWCFERNAILDDAVSNLPF